ncbi:YktB family protein [Pontibacillus litoralis]|uniref:UPF0637 protein N784_00040 n=1 Tax=Pontibacillus litoralis JSM 072002 TaxID=1385512 RepID=A0A0A5G6M3_9BACI|nr:DUF1054 domain-containing protein [Pontibacillus litoralis]KGX88776.1 hypothetical protein N784_00040 [Pontibacillus litoralis JSM 072002]
MNSFTGFTQQDFDVFSIPGLEQRMEALKTNVSPKLQCIAEQIAPSLTAMTGDEMFVHVAKHARRTTNPPNDTWAAVASSKRGYKMLPHFQIGMWESHLFIWFAMIYENPMKQHYANTLKQHITEVRNHIPDSFVWSKDHTKPDVIHNSNLTNDSFLQLLDRLENVKKAELLCGINIDRHDPLIANGEALIQKCEETFQTLEYLYRLTKK